MTVFFKPLSIKQNKKNLLILSLILTKIRIFIYFYNYSNVIGFPI